MSMMTQEEFKEKFGNILLNGLDSTQTYIPLRTNARYGINVAIRPTVMRASSSVVLFGGKLRVGYTLDDKHKPIKTNVTEISDDVCIARLKDFCKGFSWQKVNPQRFSTIIGIGVAGGVYDGDAVRAALEENKIAEDFINRLERQYKQYNGVTFGNNKSAASAALNAAWILQSNKPHIFKPLQEFKPLPEDVVGKQTPILNKAQDKYRDNVICFQQKVDDWAEQAAQEQEEDSA
jgi:hypothetical protein